MTRINVERNTRWWNPTGAISARKRRFCFMDSVPTEFNGRALYLINFDGKELIWTAESNVNYARLNRACTIICAKYGRRDTRGIWDSTRNIDRAGQLARDYRAFDDRRSCFLNFSEGRNWNRARNNAGYRRLNSARVLIARDTWRFSARNKLDCSENLRVVAELQWRVVSFGNNIGSKNCSRLKCAM